MCLSRGTKQPLSDMGGDRKRGARERLSSLVRYRYSARQPRAKDVTEPGEELRNQIDEAREQLGVMA